MGDRHGGCFARRGHPLSPLRPRVDAHRGVGFRHGARAKGFAPRRNTPLGESLPTRRTSEKICPRARRLPSTKASRHGARAKEFVPTREHAPRRRPPDTAHERKDLCRARRLSSAKASRHGARAKGFAPRRNPLLGEGLPTRREGERICPAQERSPRRKPPDTAHEPKDLPRGVRPRPTCRRTAGRPRPTDSRKTPLRRGRTREGAAAAEFIHTEKKTTP